jgi:hypothetical protein
MEPEVTPHSLLFDLLLSVAASEPDTDVPRALQSPGSLCQWKFVKSSGTRHTIGRILVRAVCHGLALRDALRKQLIEIDVSSSIWSAELCRYCNPGVALHGRSDIQGAGSANESEESSRELHFVDAIIAKVGKWLAKY